MARLPIEKAVRGREDYATVGSCKSTVTLKSEESQEGVFQTNEVHTESFYMGMPFGVRHIPLIKNAQFGLVGNGENQIRFAFSRSWS